MRTLTVYPKGLNGNRGFTTRMPGFKALILGFDDTFLDLREGYAELFSTVFRQFDIPFHAEEVLEYADTPLDTLFSQRYKGCTCRFRDFMTMTMGEYERRMFDAARLQQDAAVLKELRNQGCSLGTFSISFEEHMRRILSKLEVESLFSSVVGAERTFVPRPDPFVLNTCLREMNADKETTLVVTTSERDLETARNAKLRCALLDRSGRFEETGFGYRVSSLEDLRSL